MAFFFVSKEICHFTPVAFPAPTINDQRVAHVAGSQPARHPHQPGCSRPGLTFPSPPPPSLSRFRNADARCCCTVGGALSPLSSTAVATWPPASDPTSGPCEPLDGAHRVAAAPQPTGLSASEAGGGGYVCPLGGGRNVCTLPCLAAEYPCPHHPSLLAFRRF